MKIHCVNPLHKDATPSMHVYQDYSYCFACGFRVPTDEVLSGEQILKIKKEPESIQERLEYIRHLPRTYQRGFLLPTDNEGYYIVWPDGSFYKKRLFNSSIRYIGPRGHKAPLFLLQGNNRTLVITEGEFNALSISEVISRSIATIASSGSANELLRYRNQFLSYSKIYAIVDKDIAGVVNGLKLKEELLNLGKQVVLIAVEKDTNQIFQEEGQEGLKTWVKENLGL